MTKMVEVPLADGKIGELPVDTVVNIVYSDDVTDFVYVAEGGYKAYPQSMTMAWGDKYVGRVFTETDLPEPKQEVESPQGIGAVLLSTMNPNWNLIRTSPDTWLENNTVSRDNKYAAYQLTYSWVYVASEGVTEDSSSTYGRPTVWRDCDGDYWKKAESGYRMWNAPGCDDEWGPIITLDDPSVDYAPFVDATDEFYTEYPHA